MIEADSRKSNPSPAIALVDCNNFYASCERMFEPKLEEKPVVVLSNNDGCIVARSQQVKDLGVPMGAPLFQYERILRDAGAEIFSSNYELYGDVSSRVSASLEAFSPEIEIYSIDEAFLGLTETPKGFDYLGRAIKDSIAKWFNLEIGVGIAENKTLAKVANKIAKKSRKARGVLDLYKSPYTDAALDRTAVGDVWGIGRASVKKLESVGIKTALQFKRCDLRWAKKNFTVVGRRTILELRGVRCLPLESTPPPKKSITVSRSFGEPVTEFKEIYQAVSSFLTKAVEKMRSHRLAAQTVTVFIETSRFIPEGCRAGAETFKSAYPMDNLLELQQQTGNCLERIFAEGFEYKKAGIILGGLIPVASVSGRLYAEERLADKYDRLNRAVDEINRRFGSNTIHLAIARRGKWRMKAERRSPCYTTRLADIIKVY